MCFPEQVPLFPFTIDLAAAGRVKQRILEAHLAPGTLRNYRSNWLSFERWCAAVGARSLPATPALLIDHAAWCIAEGLRLETVHMRVKAANWMHRERGLPAPSDESVRYFLGNAARDLAERPQGKQALTPAQLRAMAPAFRARGQLIDIRDCAMVLLCFAGGWRRSELVALDFGDVKWLDQGLTLWLGKSKTDQTGRGRLVGICRGERAVTCPLRGLDAWLARRGREPGPLFLPMRGLGLGKGRLHSDGVRRAVLRGLRLIGEETGRFGAHSLRAGMITASIEAGATETSVMLRTGLRSYQTLRRYVRPATIFRSDPLAGVL
jgi:integrase